jgi:fructokinase
MFGRFLEQLLRENNIDTAGLKFSQTVNTTLAFVQLNGSGDRSFSFYRNPGADMMLEEADVDDRIIRDSRIFHFGSISMTNEPSRAATLKALKIAKENGLIISFDPNLRPPLWKSLDDAKKEILTGLKYADLLKVSEEELEFITGEDDLRKGSNHLTEMGIRFIVVTLGKKGAFYKIGDKTGHLPTYDVKVVDTTGAGDAFMGGLLYRLKDIGLPEILSMPAAEIEEMLDFSNAVGACTTTRKGGIPSVPRFDEVEECMKNVRKLLI